MSTFFFAVAWAASLSMKALESGSSCASPGSTNTSASAMSPSSSSSGFVKAACAGPRLPITTISLTFEFASTSSAWSATSVCASSSRVRASMRATSAATLPFPTTTARSADRSNSRSRKSGWPLYQATNSVAAQLDVPVEPELGVLRGLLVDAADGLDVGVIGRHAAAHQAPRRGEAVEHVDLHGEVRMRLRLEQVPRRVEARRARPDDRDPERLLACSDAC